MEKPSKLRKGILKFLPAAAAIPFRSPPISPRTNNPGKGYQGPTPSIIPKGAPRRLKSGSFDAREPSSPMVSCVGQIKSNNNNKIRDPAKLKQILPPQREVMVEEDLHHADDVKNKSQTQKQKSFRTGILKGIKQGKKGKKNAIKEISVPPNNDITLPYLGSVTKFASGRGALADFDWRAFGVAVVPDCSEPCLDEEEEKTKPWNPSHVGDGPMRQNKGNGGAVGPSCESSPLITRLASIDSLYSKCQQLLDPGESFLMISNLKKLRKLTIKKVQLILMNKLKLIYMDPVKLLVKGNVIWCDNSTELSIQVSSPSHFKIITPKKVMSFEGIQNR